MEYEMGVPVDNENEREAMVQTFKEIFREHRNMIEGMTHAEYQEFKAARAARLSTLPTDRKDDEERDVWEI